MHKTVQSHSTYAIWQKWAKVLRRQLDRIAEIYEVHEEGIAARRLHEFNGRLKLFIDPVANAQELAKRNFNIAGHVNNIYLLALGSLDLLFREALTFLPGVSEDMQRILNSPPSGQCNGRTASDIFKGPHGTVHEGIGRGTTEDHGSLPWILFLLVEEAEQGGSDYFSLGLAHSEETAGRAQAQLEPHKADLIHRRSRITATGVQ